MNKPKVLIIIDSLKLGGPGKGLFQFIRNAPNDKFDLQLCNFKYKTQKSQEFIERAAEEQIELRLFTQSFLFDPSPIFQIYQLIQELCFNIIQTHSTKAHLFAWLVTRALPIPWIAVTHGYTNENWKIRTYNRLDKWLLKKADHAVAVSPLLYQMLLSFRGKNNTSDIILNAVDKAEIPGNLGGKEIRNRCRVKNTDILMGVFGRLSPEKGQELLLVAFSRLNSNPATSLVFVGEGQNLARLEALAKDIK